MDLFEVSAEQKAGRERRVDLRYDANWPATLMLAGEVWRATVVDASVGGLGLDRDIPVPRGTVLTITLPDIGSYLCRIAWKGGQRCGLQFVRSKDDLPDEAVSSLADALLTMDQM